MIFKSAAVRFVDYSEILKQVFQKSPLGRLTCTNRMSYDYIAKKRER